MKTSRAVASGGLVGFVGRQQVRFTRRHSQGGMRTKLFTFICLVEIKPSAD